MKKLSYYSLLAILAVGFVPVAVPTARAEVSAFAKKAKIKKKFAKLGIKAIPNLETAVKRNKSASSKGLSASASATPPLLSAVLADVTGSFWAAGTLDDIIAGTATEGQCKSFHPGLNACQNSVDTKRAFSTISEAGISACYLKGIPTAVSGVERVSGEGAIGDIFKPGASAKLVKVNISGGPAEGEGGDTVMASIPSLAELSGSIKFKLAFCQGASATGFDYIEVTPSGQMIAYNSDSHEDGSHHFSFRGALTLDSNNRVVFDPTKERHVQVNSESSFGSFNQDVTIRGSHLLVQGLGQFGDSEEFKLNSDVTFAGSDAESLRISNGASITYHDGDQHSGGFRWNGDNYESFARQPRLDDVEEGGFNDEFFSEPVEVPSAEELGIPSCNDEITDEINVDMDTPALQAVAQGCEPERGDFGGNICFGDQLVQQAMMSYHDSCDTGGGQPGEGGPGGSGPGEGGPGQGGPG